MRFEAQGGKILATNHIVPRIVNFTRGKVSNRNRIIFTTVGKMFYRGMPLRLNRNLVSVAEIDSLIFGDRNVETLTLHH